MAYRFELRRDTAANWTAGNPVLAAGEPGVETDTHKLKIGDGVTAWASLPYVSGTGGTGGGAVDSVNGKVGVVTLSASDVGAVPTGTLGTAATHAATDFDPAGAATAAQAAAVTAAATDATTKANAAQAAAIQRANHTGTQAASTITGLATVATSGAYTDLSGRPTVPATQSVAATVAASGAAIVNAHNPVNAASAALTITLPTGQAQGAIVSVEKEDASANLVTITGSIRGSASSVALSWQYESVTFIADAAGSWWPRAGHKTKAALDTAYAPANSATPIVRLGVFTDSANPNSLAEYVATAGEQPTAVIAPYNYVMQPDVTALNAHHAAGREPLITWMPNGASAAIADNAAYSLSNIIAGNFDAYMTTFLNTIKGLGYEVMIRWGTEMNGNWNPWSEQVNGNSAGQFALAWKHVVNLARSLGVTNVKWMWCPTTTFTTSTPLAGLWPGDSYVDLIGVDGYNWGASGPGGLLSPSQLFDPTFAEIATFTTGKPLWIAEMGTQDTNGDKPAWITTFFSWMLQHHIAGFVWFNASVAENGSTYDWRVNSSPAAATAFGQGMATLRAATRPTGTVTFAAADKDTAWRGVQDFTSAKVVGLPAQPAAPLPTPAQIGAQPAITTIRYFTANYTLALSDAGNQLSWDGSTAGTFTIPLNSAVAFPIGSTVIVAQSGTGTLTVAATSGATLNSRGGAVTVAGRYGVAALMKVDTDKWWLYGDIA